MSQACDLQVLDLGPRRRHLYTCLVEIFSCSVCFSACLCFVIQLMKRISLRVQA